MKNERIAYRYQDLDTSASFVRFWVFMLRYIWITPHQLATKCSRVAEIEKCCISHLILPYTASAITFLSRHVLCLHPPGGLRNRNWVINLCSPLHPGSYQPRRLGHENDVLGLDQNA